jgi:hypothetical protein
VGGVFASGCAVGEAAMPIGTDGRVTGPAIGGGGTATEYTAGTGLTLPGTEYGCRIDCHVSQAD